MVTRLLVSLAHSLVCNKSKNFNLSVKVIKHSYGITPDKLTNQMARHTTQNLHQSENETGRVFSKDFTNLGVTCNSIIEKFSYEKKDRFYCNGRNKLNLYIGRSTQLYWIFK